MKLSEKLLIRKTKELRKLCLRNTKEHPVAVEELMKVQKRYDKLADFARNRESSRIFMRDDYARSKDEDFAIEGLDESERKEENKDVNC